MNSDAVTPLVLYFHFNQYWLGPRLILFSEVQLCARSARILAQVRQHVAPLPEGGRASMLLPRHLRS
jgi:hypothetical protein